MLRKTHLLIRSETLSKCIYPHHLARKLRCGGKQAPSSTPQLGRRPQQKRRRSRRKRESVMCRLRVYHTWLTQSFLLKQPFCYACDSLYTVRRILIESPDLQDTRRKYFSVTDQYRLFREVNPSRIVGYLKELGIYGNI
ncbi:tick transposon [Plakobranchus ocellatus]|uniref:Tick transposon n=1 Tax=Plakobranchus ocellatus TaxID=259542 RepID=A0AAV4B0E3_9GAST|nr:tick transposon [Plakobranchus ocellatus]